jgi:hypothetical protein
MNDILYVCFLVVLFSVVFVTVRWIDRSTRNGTREQYHGGIAAGLILIPLECLVITVVFFWLFPNL